MTTSRLTDHIKTYRDPIRWIELPHNDDGSGYFRVDAINWFAKRIDDDGVQFTIDGDNQSPNLTTLPLDQFIKRLTGEEEK